MATLDFVTSANSNLSN